MIGSKLRRPKLPSHYLLRFEPPDGTGDEALVITSERRRIKLKGHSFREFLYEVVPLLDGTTRVGPCFLLASSEPGMAGLCRPISVAAQCQRPVAGIPVLADQIGSATGRAAVSTHEVT